MILIAGAGDVGMAVAERLHAEGQAVATLRRSAQDVAWTAVQADLTDPPALERSLAALPGVIASVVYLPTAGERTAEAYREIYVDGLANLLAALPELERLVLVSSTAVYGYDDGRDVDESTPTFATSPTSEVLIEAEQLAVSAGPALTTVVPFAGIYGPGRTRLIDDVRAGKATLQPEPVFTNRIHRDDAAGLLAAVLAADVPPSRVIGVDDDPAPRDEVLPWLAEQLGVPAPMADPDAAPRSRGGNKRCRNVALHELGYVLAYPTFREGYAELLG